MDILSRVSSQSPWSFANIPAVEVATLEDVECKMRDGTVLKADIYRPDDQYDYPVLLMRTPYSKQIAQTLGFLHPSHLARYGYMVVVQDCRGTWCSDGEWYPFKHDVTDGVDAIAWAAALPGGTGKVATYGFSYGGATQLLPMTVQDARPTTMVPALTASQYYREWMYKGGLLQLQLAQSWALGFANDQGLRKQDEAVMSRVSETRGKLLNDAFKPPIKFLEGVFKELTPYYRDWLKNETYNDYWKRWSINEHYEDFDIPALHVAGWYDVFLEGNLENYIGVRTKSKSDFARNNQKLVVGPWYHMSWHQKVGMIDFSDAAQNCVNDLMLMWFDKYLKGKSNQLDDEPPVCIFVMGENRWRFEDDWPVPRAKEHVLNLHSNGKANTMDGDGMLTEKHAEEEPPDIYIYNPIRPIMSVGGRGCIDETFNLMGQFDQGAHHGFRNDVLYFKTPILTSELEVTGKVELDLYIASSAPDTDFIARLVDICPGRVVLNVVEGALRAKYRNSYEKPELMEPGEVYRLKIDVGSTSYVFKQGHSIGLEITSSSFPIYDRNSNSGKSQVELQEIDYKMATQHIFHDSRYPSQLTLPVIPRKGIGFST